MGRALRGAVARRAEGGGLFAGASTFEVWVGVEVPGVLANTSAAAETCRDITGRCTFSARCGEETFLFPKINL